MDVTDVVDITATLERKVAAARCHRTPMRNFVHQLRLQARTGDWSVPILDDAFDSEDPAAVGSFVEKLVRGGAGRTGETHNLGAAEEFRVVRFGGLTTLLDRYGIKLPE